MRRARSLNTNERSDPASAHASWRWRHLYLRALLDAELKANGGTPNDACYEAFAELIDIYHAHDTEPHVRPPLPEAWRTDSQTTRTKGSR